jgi:hypothetical protein
MTEGAGIQDNLTLEPSEFASCVCIECNSYLGATLDEPFGRDSIEGTLRFIKGKKKRKAIKNQHWNRVRLKSDGNAGLITGAESKMLFDGTEMFTRPNSQVQIRNIASGMVESFEENRFEVLIERQQEFDFSSLTLIASENLTDSQWQMLKTKLENLLSKIGKKIESSSELKTFGGVEETILQGNYDEILLRAIAKIAFNYMTVVFNELDSSVIFLPGLDEIRAYIRHGTKPSFVAVEKVDECMSALSTMSHSVRLQCAMNETMVASARICLFNQIVWQVILSRDLEGVAANTQSGHQWCFDSEKCFRIY